MEKRIISALYKNYNLYKKNHNKNVAVPVHTNLYYAAFKTEDVCIL